MPAQTCSCGFIIIDRDENVLIGHPTRCGDRWDLPKGKMDPGELPFEAAVRELKEETGITLPSESIVVDLGRAKYVKGKDLQLYVWRVDTIDVSSLICESMVMDGDTPLFPEMDAFKMLPAKEAFKKFGKNMQAWITANVPKTLIDFE